MAGDAPSALPLEAGQEEDAAAAAKANPQEGLDLNAVCRRFLPLLAKHEGWPEGKVEHMMVTGEAMSAAVVLAQLMQDQGVTEEQVERRIASGEVSALLRALAEASKANQDPTPQLMQAIYGGRPVFKTLLESLDKYLHKDARGFAVDLASGSTYFPQSFVRKWPRLKVYPSDHGNEQHLLLGMGFMEWCMQQFAMSPDRDFEDLARRDRAGELENLEEQVQLNLLDTVWYPNTPPYLSPEADQRASLSLWDRAVDVDVTSDQWAELAHLQGGCRLVTCTNLLVQVGYRNPEIWHNMLCQAAKLLVDDGVLLLYDATKWGSYLDKSVMEGFIADKELPLTVVLHKDMDENPQKNPMALMVLRKKAGSKYDVEAIVRDTYRYAQRLREEGNLYFKPGQDRNVPLALRCYTRALDALSAVTGHIAMTTQVDHREMKSRLESNLSAVLLEVGRPEEALAAADRTLQWDPTWAKGHYRRVKALEALGRVEDLIAARALFGQVAEQSGGDKDKAALEADAAPSGAPGADDPATAPASPRSRAMEASRSGLSNVDSVDDGYELDGRTRAPHQIAAHNVKLPLWLELLDNLVQCLPCK